MPREMGSTGCRNGAASFSFFNVRTVDTQNRCCEVDITEVAVWDDGEGVALGGGPCVTGEALIGLFKLACHQACLKHRQSLRFH